ncbi:MAG TPA: o-succinylbenzoate synthase [Bacteroidales bacterium]|nr:o-succinylbenzoate synthase [Bacteroidales bacterium]
MNLKTTVEKRTLHFHKPAGTSRGFYHTHDVWYVRVSSKEHPQAFGIGECAPLHDLSCDFGADYEERLQAACSKLEETGVLDTEGLRNQPSILFGLETAMRQLEISLLQNPPQNTFALWDTPFSRSEQGIRINGLIWMGSFLEMEAQIREKLKKGFRCIKLKIGAIRFEEEWALLQQIRKEYTAETVTLRVDANGAFSPADALEKLKRLSELNLHSIEQPIRAGQVEVLADLIRTSPLPIALDEELIGVFTKEQKTRLLDTLMPPFLVLKPTLHGGISGCNEWIDLAKERGIDWWMTSALESNIGLNAVAHYCATLNNPLHQGLGTGLLYKDNVDMPLQIDGEQLWFRP